MPAAGKRGPVFVTGASSGIGRAVAERLAGQGVTIFATARKPADLDDLARLPNVTPVRVDVRDRDQVAAAVTSVEAAGGGLYGLVNNAGVGGIGPFAAYTEDEIEDIFAVNVFGPVRLTLAFLPLLLRSRGRVVNVGSQGGLITAKYFGPYTMTKHALEAETAALDRELADHGVRVSIVQPGGVATEIGRNSDASTRARFERAPEPFQGDAKRFLGTLDQEAEPDPAAPESPENRKPSPPGLVADAVEDALYAETPRATYLVGTRWEGDRVVQALLDRVLDANQCPSMGYSRDELVARLEERLATRKVNAPGGGSR